MRHITFKFLSVLAIFLTACGELVEIPDVKPEGSEPVPSPAEEAVFGPNTAFTASISDRYDIDGSTIPSSWTEGETIALFDGSSNKTITVRQSGQTTSFTVDVTQEAEYVYAISPSGYSSFADGTLQVEFPSEQTVGKLPSFLVSKAESAHMFFSSIHSEVFFTVDMDGVKTVEFEASAPISGRCKVDFADGIAINEVSSSKVTLKGDFIKGEKYSFTCLPANIDSYTMKLSNEHSVIATLKGNSLNLKASSAVDLGTVIEDVPTYKVAHLWIFGGTGPEYGGGKVYDLFTKSDFFNSEDGRGIEALQDNYFEMRHDGTFQNWAGEDARNWWMVYSGKHNPTNGKDIDLSELLDIIPRSQATWSYTENDGITFDKGSAGIVTATILGPDTHTLYQNGDTKVTVTTTSHISLLFKLSGGHDDWNNMYNEYNAIACRPRAMIVELDPMEVDFHTPEASRTVDADFKYVAPPETSEKFDFESLPGSWNVRGGNSSPYGLWVLGGTGDDPAFISPIDKSWLWDDTIWKESDNELVMEVSSMTATEIRGTTNYWAGNDGQFWNYKWNYTGEDLSRFFGLLPHGKYDFVMNLETFEITLGNSVVAKFLEPGTHTFVHGRTLDIPEGCFGLSFELGTPEMDNPTADRWNDVDRFIYGIRNYVMIFEK